MRTTQPHLPEMRTGEKMKLNLHTHSVKSDGVFTPEEVVKIQRDDGIEAMSLTDHDNVSGID